MTPNEVRCGNLIQFNGEQIVANSFDIAMIEGGDKEYNPIHITEDWLKKLGFEQEYDSNWWFIGKFKIRQLVNLETYTFYNYDTDIEYIHQLQNLYFALTGTELTIQ